MKKSFIAALLAGVGICGAALAQNNAVLESVVYPQSMQAGKTYPVSVTFRNNGTTTWTTGTPESLMLYRLGAISDSMMWGLKRVEKTQATVAPGATQTFNFTVTAPANNTGQRFYAPFAWQMVHERVGWFGQATPSVNTNQQVDVANAPVIDQIPLPQTIRPIKSVRIANASEMTFANFRGANVVNKRYAANGNKHTEWFHNEADTVALLNAAQRMNINVLRIPVVIPPSPGSQAFDPAEWGQQTSSAALSEVIRKTQFFLNEAAKRQMKVIVTFDGYTKYGHYDDDADRACYWKHTFLDIQANARAFVSAIYNYSALYAWDLLNEPLHNATHSAWPGRSGKSCVESSPNVLDPKAFKSVVNAVHEMYNLVRELDPLNHYTTVSDGNVAYMDYWADISSFYSYHMYYNVQVGYGDHTTKGEFLRGVQRGTLEAIKNKPASAQRPVAFTEFGYRIEDGTADIKVNWYQNYLLGLKQLNIGGAFWSLSTFNEYKIADAGLPLECVIKNIQTRDYPIQICY